MFNENAEVFGWEIGFSDYLSRCLMEVEKRGVFPLPRCSPEIT